MKYLIFITALLLSAGAFARAQTASEMSQQLSDNEAVAQEETEPEEPLSVKPEPVMEIKQLGSDKPLYSFELRDVEIGDLLRVLAHDYKLNLLVDKEVAGKVTASLSSISLEEALETIAESQNLNLKKKGNIIRVSPNLITKIFTLRFIEAREILESFSYSEASQPSEASAAASNTTQASSSSAEGSESAGPNTIYDLLSDKGKILLGKRQNSLVVIDYPPYVERVEEYLKEIDKKMASRVFKLKYLKAADVVWQTSSNTTSTTNTSSSTNTTTTGS